MAISKKSWLGVAREATSGTAITTPTKFIPCKSTMKNIQHREYLDEERGTRDGNYDVVNTTRESAWDVKGPFYVDTHPYLLIAGMGSVASVAQSDATVYKHTISFADVPPSLTLMKSFDAKTYYTPYSVVEKFTIKIASAAKLIELDASGKGLWMTAKTSPPTPAYSTVKPFAGYVPTISLTGGASMDIDELEIEFSQKITLWDPADGTPDWASAYFGERDIKFKYTARFDNDTNYLNFLNGTNDTLTLDVMGPIISTTFHSELNVVLPTISYDSMEHDLGKDNVLIKAAGKAIVGSNAAPMTLFVQNLIASYTV